MTSRIAVVGCSHGSLDDIYASIQRSVQGLPLTPAGNGCDLVICCGDFQAMRNPADLLTLSCPPKYRSLGSFPSYYNGRTKAPYLTVVIGGNHEASGYMWELYYGGWLAENIYYLGAAGSVVLDGWLNVSGIGGIWKSHDFKKGHFETVPYDDRAIKSVYHIREFDVAKMLLLKHQALASAAPGLTEHLFMSHDWPVEIPHHGDKQDLLRRKPFFKAEVERNELGSPPLQALLQTLKPRYWFSAHLHVKFSALLKHTKGAKTEVLPRKQAQKEEVPVELNPDEIPLDDDDDVANPDEIQVDEEEPEAMLLDAVVKAKENPDEINLEDDEEDAKEEDVQAPVVAEASANRVEEALVEATKFLALDKPGYGRDFVQILDVGASSSASSAVPAAATPNEIPAAEAPAYTPPVMTFDPRWLAITRAFEPNLSLEVQQKAFPPKKEWDALLAKELAWVRENVGTNGVKAVDDVQVFKRTAPGMGEPGGDYSGPPSWFTNPQTEALCELLQMPNRINPMPEEYRAELKKREAEEKVRMAEELRLAKEAALKELEAKPEEQAPEEQQAEA